MAERPDHRRLSRPKSAVVLGSLAALLIIAAPALGGHPDGAPGNNGTIKVHDNNPGEPDPEVKNQPHVCQFDLHFFFGDAGQTGDWWIKEWPPTSESGPSNDPEGAVLMDTYEDPDMDREDREPDGEGAYYTLPNGHYKLFWEGAPTPAQDDDDVNIKHKVFWVECPEETATPTPTPTEGQLGGTPTPTPTPTPTGAATPTPTPTEAATPTPTPTGGELGGTPTPTPTIGGQAGAPTPTEAGGVLGGNPTPAAGGLPNTAAGPIGGDSSAAALMALLALLSLAALTWSHLRSTSLRR